MKNSILQNRKNHSFYENYNFSKHYILHILLNTLFPQTVHTSIHIKIYGEKRCLYSMYAIAALLVFPKSVTK